MAAMLVTKLNQRGDSLWQFRPDASFCPYTERVMALIEDDAANVYTTGSICIDSTMRQLTAKLGRDGAVIWQNISADTVGLEYAQGNGICLDNGKVIVAGGTRIDDCSTGTLTVFKAHGRDGGSPELLIGSDSEISSFFWQTVMSGNNLYLLGENIDHPQGNYFSISCFQLNN